MDERPVTREEFMEHDRVERDQTELTKIVAGIAEDLADFWQEFLEFRVMVESRFAGVDHSIESRFTELRQLIESNHAALVSLLMARR